MAVQPLLVAGYVTMAASAVILGSEWWLTVLNRQGLVGGGLTPKRGESPSQLQERNRQQDNRLRSKYRRLRPWAATGLVVGLAILIVGAVA